MCALLGITANAPAADSSCKKLSAETSGPEMNYRPPLEGEVVGEGKTFLYSAPSDRCKYKHVFVVRGVYLTVYKPHKNWLNVMYIARGGEDHIGWVRKDPVRLLGHYGEEQQIPNLRSSGRAESARRSP
ncbi:MAG: hypothetical protein JWM02_3581 [Frankiales bacterium]|nr:hypothetical protein [Frankiales bacterium]